MGNTNIWAILGLVFGILMPPLGVIFSIVALVQINKTHKEGKGIAIAGLIIGLFLSIVPMLVIMFWSIKP